MLGEVRAREPTGRLVGVWEEVAAPFVVTSGTEGVVVGCLTSRSRVAAVGLSVLSVALGAGDSVVVVVLAEADLLAVTGFLAPVPGLAALGLAVVGLVAEGLVVKDFVGDFAPLDAGLLVPLEVGLLAGDLLAVDGSLPETD